jgi:CheY-like chemotaxis protein
MPTKRVLLVEDDEDIRELLKDVLRAEGYQAEVARDGLDALGKLDGDHEPWVIVLDMMMPRMDGEAFLQELRRDPTRVDTPVVVVSGNSTAREKARELRVAACLTKPFELEELLRVLGGLARDDALVR